LLYEYVRCGIDMGYAGTSITPEDAEEIINEVSRAYAKVPMMFRSFLPSLPELLRKIPDCARKYTLGDLIKLLESAHEEGRI